MLNFPRWLSLCGKTGSTQQHPDLLLSHLESKSWAQAGANQICDRDLELSQMFLRKEAFEGLPFELKDLVCV